MNQTKKRLSIINLAISITDIETIQLQILKLGLLKTDTQIQEIIGVLQSENYAKAQRLIKTYIDTPMKEIMQRASQHKNLETDESTFFQQNNKIISEEEQKIIDEFQLFATDTDNSTKRVNIKEIDLNDYLTDTYFTPDTTAETIDETQTTDFDALLNIHANEIISDNTKEDPGQDSSDAFFDMPIKAGSETVASENMPRDTFFETNKEDDASASFFPVSEPKKTPAEQSAAADSFESLLTIETQRKASLIEEALNKQAESEQALQKTIQKTKDLKNRSSFESTSFKKEKNNKVKNILHDPSLENNLTANQKEMTVPENYPAIPHIRQKFINMKKQYQPIQKGHDRFPAVEALLTTINLDGYKEGQIEETLSHVEKLIKEQKFSEAAQLLLLCASTESKFAQLMLARELYRGVLLRKKVPESFTLLTRLADENYPEALCDLGQFYENGIGTGKNKKVAKELYEKAMNLGIKRAEKHYARIKKATKSFFK